MKNNESAYLGILIFIKNLVFWGKYLYICINIHSAFQKNSKWFILSESNFTKDNIPSRLTSVAHLGGLLFYKPLAL